MEAAHASAERPVDVLVVVAVALIERPDRLPGETRDQHRGERRREQLAVARELAEVDEPGVAGRAEAAHARDVAEAVDHGRQVGATRHRVHRGEPPRRLQRDAHQLADRVRLERGVVVEQEEVLARGGRDAEVAGGREARVAAGLDEHDLGELGAQQFVRAVARAAVHDDDLEGGVALIGERTQAGSQQIAAVVRRDHDRDTRPVFRRRRAQRLAVDRLALERPETTEHAARRALDDAPGIRHRAAREDGGDRRIHPHETARAPQQRPTLVLRDPPAGRLHRA